MIKIKLHANDLHRNECVFRPFRQNKLFNDVGIQFVTEGNKYDMVWLGQASYMDKSKPYNQSISDGIKFVEQFKGQDVMLIDGQDSATLMGSWDVFKESDAKLLLKNTLYKYKSISYCSCVTPNGRMYWSRENTYKFSDCYYLPYSDLETEKFQNVKLSGTNWLSTIQPKWYDYSNLTKDIDVFAMFQYPAKQNFEWEIEVSKYYTKHRKKCIEQLKLLPKHIKVVTAENGKVPINEYYNLMARSKIVLAPFGYGEIAPRDLESVMFGCVLVKPDMEHIETIPNIYSDPKNFIACQWDFSDLDNIINNVLKDYETQQHYYVNNMKRAYLREYDDEKLVLHIYNILKGLEGYD